MKKVRRLLILIVAVTMLLCACGNAGGTQAKGEKLVHEIILCGELHSDDISIKNELVLWGHYYAKGARHLFIESSYAEGCFLNEWMKAEDDEILDQIWADTEGTQGCKDNSYNFWKAIKRDYPETIFHATDIGHQYYSIGKRYLEFLETNGKKDTEEYELALENYKQGETYYGFQKEGKEREGYDYREECMIANFIREYEKLPNEFVMGIYGWAHADLDGFMYYGTGKINNMAKQLREKYDDALTVVNAHWVEPIRVDEIEVSGKTYSATYYGLMDISNWGWEDYVALEFWRLEDAYDDFKDCPVSYGFSLNYVYYPMKVELNQVFIVDITRSDGSAERMYMRADGATDEAGYITAEFFVD